MRKIKSTHSWSKGRLITKSKIKKVKQTKRGKKQDSKKDAMPAGKRVSKRGNIYYEKRSNRAD